MNKVVEILKIGNILPAVSSSGKKTIMIVSDGEQLFDYYVSILIQNCDEYSFLKTSKSIVGKPQVFRSSLLGNQFMDTLKGLSDGDPVVGQSFTIKNSSWYTSKVEQIIDDCIIITKNSVYAIHNLSDVRNKKINNLGL
jgi:hypothetical protein